MIQNSLAAGALATLDARLDVLDRPALSEGLAEEAWPVAHTRPLREPM